MSVAINSRYRRYQDKAHFTCDRGRKIPRVEVGGCVFVGLRTGVLNVGYLDAFSIMQVAASRSTKSISRNAKIVQDVTLTWF
jgi:hypothetical protein